MPLRSMMPLNLSWDPIEEADDDYKHDITKHQSENGFMSPALDWIISYLAIALGRKKDTMPWALDQSIIMKWRCQSRSIHDELCGLELGTRIMDLRSYVWLLSFGILHIPYPSRDLSSWRRRSSKLYKSSARSSCFSRLWLRVYHVQKRSNK